MLVVSHNNKLQKCIAQSDFQRMFTFLTKDCGKGMLCTQDSTPRGKSGISMLGHTEEKVLSMQSFNHVSPVSGVLLRWGIGFHFLCVVKSLQCSREIPYLLRNSHIS